MPAAQRGNTLGIEGDGRDLVQAKLECSDCRVGGEGKAEGGEARKEINDRLVIVMHDCVCKGSRERIGMGPHLTSVG